MIEFWLGALILFSLAALFLLCPSLFLRQSHQLEVEESRQLEVESHQPEVEGHQPEIESSQTPNEGGQKDSSEPDANTSMYGEQVLLPASSQTLSLGLTLLLPLVVMALALYHFLGAAPDIRIAFRLQGLSIDENGVEEYRRLMADIEQRAAQRPDNLRYRAMLGRYYMDGEDYERARQLYLGLAEAAPEDASAAALAAQAGYMAAGGVLDGDSQLLAEQALSLDPHQRTALGLLGMASYENGQYRAAVSYWERLLALEDPKSSPAQVIQGVIERARQKAEDSTKAGDGPGQE